MPHKEKLPRYVSAETTRHGKKIYYYRRSGGRIRLPDAASPDFLEAVNLAAEKSVSIAPPPPPRQTFDQRRRGEAGRAISRLYKAAKRRARKRHLVFDLEEDWLLRLAVSQDFKCAVTGVPFFTEDIAGMRVNPYAPSLDRIAAKGGYTKDNVRLVIFALNIMFNEWGEAVFARVANGYRRLRYRHAQILSPHQTQKVRDSQAKSSIISMPNF